MSDVTIRRVTEDDYSKVISIRTAYGGRDYLHSLFHELIQHNDGFAVLVGDKMVAFQLVMLVDGGMTMLPRAGRVHKDYEGMGLYKKLEEFTMEHYSRNPRVQFKAVSFHNRNPSLMKKVEEGFYHVTFERKLLTYRSTIEKMRVFLEDQTLSSKIKPVDRSMLIHILGNREITDVLFPRQVFSSCWTPLRIMQENSEHVFSNLGTVFISNMKDKEAVVLTIGHPVKSAIGLSYILDVYGFCQDDLIDHVLWHLDTVKDYEEDVLQLEVFADDKDHGYVRQMACNLDFEKYDQEEHEMHCIEKKISH